MNTNVLTIILFGVIGVLLLVVLCKKTESFGQDPSIRFGAGGVAGPIGLYGYDPVTHFHRQIQDMRRGQDNPQSANTKECCNC